MTTLILFAKLLFTDHTTTDDVWDCYRTSDGTEVCEREVWPCHYVDSPDECVIRVVRK